MKAFYTLLILLIPFVGFGQNILWEKSYNFGDFEVPSDVVQNNIFEDGFVFTGFVNQDLEIPNTQSILIVKTNTVGDTLWSKIITISNRQEAQKIVEAKDGGYIVSGTIQNQNEQLSSDILLIKLNSLGYIEWNKQYGGNEWQSSYGLDKSSDGGYVIVGSRNIEGNPATHLYIIKTNITGDTLWTKSYSFGLNEVSGQSISETYDGGYVISAFGQDDNGTQVYLIKIDTFGSVLWLQTYGGYEIDGSEYIIPSLEVIETNDNGFIFTYSDNDGVIKCIKTNNMGNVQWEQTYDFEGWSVIFDLLETDDLGYVFAGHSYTADNNYGIFFKTNEFGNIIWTLEDQSSKAFSSLTETFDGDFIVTGADFSETTEEECFLIKIDGNTTSTFEIPLPNTNRNLEKIVNLKGQEVKPQKNKQIIEIFDDGSIEKKIIIE